jgi:hypothetical protein
MWIFEENLKMFDGLTFDLGDLRVLTQEFFQYFSGVSYEIIYRSAYTSGQYERIFNLQESPTCKKFIDGKL